ncbi:MAG: hypothetical protein SPG61_03345 [Arcanobacterium sp.]|nr:hypothetical protein [Arcanobacterium sp.]
MFSRRSVVSLGVFVVFMLSLFGVAYLKMPALSEEEFLQLSAEQQYEILIENGMEPYPGESRNFHLRVLKRSVKGIITGEHDSNLNFYGYYPIGAQEARIGKTLYEMGYPKVIKPEPPNYFTLEEFNHYNSEVESRRLKALE